MSKRAKSKIAKSEARACADDLISALQSASAAEKLVAELVGQYTVGARTLIIDQAFDLATGKRQSTLDENVIEPLIRELVSTPKPQGLDKLILSLAKFVDVVLANRGKGWTLGVIAADLGRSEEGLANMQTFSALGKGLRNNGDYLAESLTYIVDSKSPVWAVQLWECMARPAIGDFSRPYSIAMTDTSKIIAQISRLRPELSSEGLPLLIPILLNRAESDSRDTFLATSIGRAYWKNLLGSDEKAGRDKAIDPDPLLNEADRQLLQRIQQRLLDKNQEFDSALEETKSKYVKKLADYQSRLRQAQSEYSRLNGQLQMSKDNISQLESREEKNQSDLAAKDNELTKQAAEIRHLEREKMNQEADQEDRHHDALQKKLVEPAATVRDLVIEICSPKVDSRVEPRSLAVAFDTLHRRILNLAKVEDDRIPRNILSGKKE